MTEREKLIELLDEVHHRPLGKEYRERLGTIADFLIENGVRIPVRCVDCENYDPEEGVCTIKNDELGNPLGVLSTVDYCSDRERRKDGV